MEDWSIDSLREGKVLAVYKPLDWTSFDVVNKIKFAIRKSNGLKKFKVGHAGTLDPRATGLLIVCVGRATKTIPELMGRDKRYVATLKLGATTPSYDTETEENQQFPIDHITREAIEAILPQFTGEIMQVPPVFSALKKDGKRLYELARKGKEVEIPARPISIHSIEILRFEENELVLDVHCGKGTYIRSLAHDIGAALNSGAYLVGLERTAIGEVTLEGVQQVADICQLVRDAASDSHLPDSEVK